MKNNRIIKPATKASMITRPNCSLSDVKRNISVLT